MLYSIFQFNRIHSSARRDYIRRIADLRTPRNVAHSISVPPQFRFEFPAIFYRMYTSIPRYTTTIFLSLHYVHVAIAASDRHAQNVRAFRCAWTEWSPAHTVTTQLTNHRLGCLPFRFIYRITHIQSALPYSFDIYTT